MASALSVAYSFVSGSGPWTVGRGFDGKGQTSQELRGDFGRSILLGDTRYEEVMRG